MCVCVRARAHAYVGVCVLKFEQHQVGSGDSNKEIVVVNLGPFQAPCHNSLFNEVQ